MNDTAGALTAEFKVSDTGIGIDQAYVQKIFESFWQVYQQSDSKYSGTGLGLAISKKIINLMGGDLYVQSQPRAGSTFYFSATFPKTELQRATQETKERSDLTGYRILLADDNLINLLIVRKLLQDWQADVPTCKNGEEVLQSLRRNRDFDIVLLDLDNGWL